MKKYYGNGKLWSETLYFYTVDEFDLMWFEEQGKDFVGVVGDRNYYLPEVPFGKFDKNSVVRNAIIDYNDYEDTNPFIVNSEMFNIYKSHRI